MRMGTRLKLASIYLSLAVMLSVTLGISFMLAYNAFKTDKSFFTFNNARLLTNTIINDAERNYSRISDFNSFSKTILPKLNKIKSELLIIDLKGRILFDSGDGKAYEKGTTVDIEAYIHYDAGFQAANPGIARLAFPLVVDGSQVGNAVFTLPENLIGKDVSRRKVFFMLLPAIAGFTCTAVIILVLLVRLSRGVLSPLEQLNKSANEIARGNLDIKLKFESDNELGEFTRAFDFMREELKDSLKKQAEYEKSRKELIASISHDIKTPVASIKAYVEGLQDGIAKDPATVGRYVSVIKKKTDSLSKLVEDLFHHSLRELGRFRINMEEQYSGKLLSSIIDPLRIQFDKSKVSFIVNEPLPDVLINVDAARIEQVILNLIQNARKYTPEGGSIYFNSIVEDEYLHITVRDTGIGIPPEDLPFIFEQFYRGEKARSSANEGAGLGLSICKYIVEEHGGQVFVNSRLNEGSSFTFTIPKV